MTAPSRFRDPLARRLGRVVWRQVTRLIRRERHEPLMLNRQYQVWLARERLAFNRCEAQMRLDSLEHRPLISLLVPVFDPGRGWLEQALASVTSQLYPHWELCAVDDGSTQPHVRRLLRAYARRDARVRVWFSDRNEGICGASNHALRLARGEFIAPVDHDDWLAPEALLEVAEVLNRDPRLDFVYTDHDLIDGHLRRSGPFFKPDWSPDLLLSMNYITHFSVLRRQLVEQLGGFRPGFEGAEDLDLLLRCTEVSDRIAHIARPVYSWGQAPTSVAGRPDAKPYAHDAGRRALQAALVRRGIDGEVVDGLGAPYRYRVKRRILGRPRVSIIVAPRGDRAELARCLDSLARQTAAIEIELIVSRAPGDPPLPSNAGVRFVEPPAPFRLPIFQNRAARQASGEHLLFLSDAVEPVQPGWLEAMLEHSQRDDVGAVGAKLLASDGTIAHAGMVLGVGGAAGPAFHGLSGDHPGYYDLARVIRNVSAVAGDCLMMRRDTFERLEGFDEHIQADEDLDLCLRLRERGLLIVYTPYAVLRRHVPARPPLRSGPRCQATGFERRWAHVIHTDPYYNPHLTREQFDFALKMRSALFVDGLRRDQLQFRRYFKGRGLEIGGLHDPMPIDARRATVRHVDHLTPGDQRVHYPELAEYSLVPTTIVADASHLPVHDASHDFVIANQLLQQLADPIGALIEWRRVLVPSGLLFMTIQNERQAGDRSRPRTPLAHLIADHRDDGAGTRAAHYEEHVARTPLASGIEPREYARRLMAMGYSVPCHVWTPDDIRELLDYLRDAGGQAWSVVRWVEPRHGDELMVLLRA